MDSKAGSDVRRQGFWYQRRLKLRESLAHLVGFIMRRIVCDASAAFEGVQNSVSRVSLDIQHVV
jgi:hypothetical protein